MQYTFKCNTYSNTNDAKALGSPKAVWTVRNYRRVYQPTYLNYY